MRKIAIIALLALTVITGCEKEDKATLDDSTTTISTTLSINSLVLTKDNASGEALTVSWKTSEFNIPVPVQSYTVEFSYNDQKAVVAATKSPLTLTGEELNNILAKLKFDAGVATDIKVKVLAKLGASKEIASAEKKLTATRYEDVIQPSEWGVVGTINGWNAPDIPFWDTDDNLKVAYITLKKSDEFKIRKGASWDKGGNLGGKTNPEEVALGQEKVLSNGGNSGNLKVPEDGTYRIILDDKKPSIIVEKYSWGLIGNAAKGFGDKDDIAMTYNGAYDRWEIDSVVLTGGGDNRVKFRLNNSWSTNFGKGDTDGVLKSGGGDIPISKSGTYKVIMKFKGNTGSYEFIAK